MPSGAGVNERVDALENKMDAILGMLQRMTPPAQQQPAPQPVEEQHHEAPSESELEPSPAPPVCENTYDEDACEAWARDGECTNNPAFMKAPEPSILHALNAPQDGLILCCIPVAVANKPNTTTPI